MIMTKPAFLYGYVINADTTYINFREDIVELTARVKPGRYTFTDLAAEVATAMSLAGNQIYTVTTDRVNRRFTISADNNFEILFDTGSNKGLSPSSIIGFGTMDYTGANTYTGSTTGKIYSPTFWPQSHTGTKHWKGYKDASIIETGDGDVETFAPSGLVSYMEMEFKFITDLNPGDPWDANENAVDEVLDFLSYAITKGYMEYMENRDTVEEYQTVVLDSTPQSKDGILFKLLPQGSGWPDWYRTGKLVFRERV